MPKQIKFAPFLLLYLLSGVLFAQSPDTLKTYIFGHSLINHELQVNPTPSNETSVPHWFHFLAEAENEPYAVSGQYGFIPQHARNLPPMAQWGFDSVASAWEDWREPFSDADFDNILITPGNFIQWQGPSVDYYNDSISPLDATSMVFDWCDAQEDSLTFYIYENWPDMAPYLNNGFPPTQSEWNNYNNYLNGAFHDWFLEYHDSLILAHPDKCVRMIPVGPILSNLLNQAPFDQIAIDTLYEDDAPHGRPTIYFLASMVTYMAMYERPTPAGFAVDPIIDPIVANNYSQARSFIWSELNAFNDAGGNSRVWCGSQILAIEEEENQGVEEVLQESGELVVYPNPTSGRVHLQGLVEGAQVQVLDLAGRVFQVGLDANGGLDLTGLSDGMYLVRVTDLASGVSEVVRIIKQGN